MLHVKNSKREYTVFKFGSSAVGVNGKNIPAIVSQLIQDNGYKKVVVASAFPGVTDKLIEERACPEHLFSGELEAALRFADEFNGAAKIISPCPLKISWSGEKVPCPITPEESYNIRINYSETKEEIKKRMNGNNIYIVPGFGIPPILPRGGSDLVALWTAIALNAELVFVKDSGGIYNEKNEILSEIKISELEKLIKGTKPLHPRVLIDLRNTKINAYVRGIDNIYRGGTKIIY